MNRWQSESLSSDIPLPYAFRITVAVLTLAVMVAGCVGSLCVLIIFASDRHLWKSSYALIGFLAFVDLIELSCAGSLKICFLVYESTWIGHIGCSLIGMASTQLVDSSVLTTILIAVNRYFRVCYAADIYEKLFSMPVVAASCVAILAVTAFCNLLAPIRYYAGLPGCFRAIEKSPEGVYVESALYAAGFFLVALLYRRMMVKVTAAGSRAKQSMAAVTYEAMRLRLDRSDVTGPTDSFRYVDMTGPSDSGRTEALMGRKFSAEEKIRAVLKTPSEERIPAVWKTPSEERIPAVWKTPSEERIRAVWKTPSEERIRAVWKIPTEERNRVVWKTSREERNRAVWKTPIEERTRAVWKITEEETSEAGGKVSEKERVQTGGKVSEEERVQVGEEVSEEERVQTGGKVSEEEGVQTGGKVSEEEGVQTGGKVSEEETSQSRRRSSDGILKHKGKVCGGGTSQCSEGAFKAAEITTSETESAPRSKNSPVEGFTPWQKMSGDVLSKIRRSVSGEERMTVDGTLTKRPDCVAEGVQSPPQGRPKRPVRVSATSFSMYRSSISSGPSGVVKLSHRSKTLPREKRLDNTRFGLMACSLNMALYAPFVFCFLLGTVLEWRLPSELISLSHLLLMCASALDSLVYGAMNKSFQLSGGKLLLRIRRQRQAKIGLPSVSSRHMPSSRISLVRSEVSQSSACLR